MFAKTLIAGLLGTSMLAGAAFAQSPATTTTAPAASTAAGSTMNMQHKGQWRSSKLVGLNVYNSNNDSLGEINELLIDQSGKVQAVVIGVGGFLGIGERNVAVPMDRIKFVEEPRAAATTAANRPAGTTATGTAGTTTTTGMTGTSATGTTAARSNANDWAPDHAIFETNRDDLKAMPEFKYSN